jgi:RimK-like ATP-grasp domain
MAVRRPFAIYHEHPDWFRPLFAELDRRGIPYVRLNPGTHVYDPSEIGCPYSLVFNRMSPSAYLRDGGHATFSTLGWLAHLERIGVPVVNGLNAYTWETSKARQLTLLESLGIAYPRSRVINHPSAAVEAAKGLRYPIVVKANIGGSGAGIIRFDNADDLARAAAENRLQFGLDQTALVQEFTPARGGHIVRVELLGGEFLYAIKVFTTGDSFNLCPADICQRSDGVELQRTACPIDAPKSGLKVEGYTPPQEVIDACEEIVHASGIDVGGIEYMIDDRDGKIVYYDINALSNFVADAKNVIGFDPFVSLVDFLEHKSRTLWNPKLPKRRNWGQSGMADWDAAI